MGFLSILFFLQIQVGADQVVIKPEGMDLGYFPRDQKITMDFRIYNNSRYPLRILRVLPYCGCLRVNSFDTIIYPFTRGKVVYTFNSSGMSGPFYKEILVKTDRFGYQYLKFKLTGFVLDPPIQPKAIDLSENPAKISVYPYSPSSGVEVVSRPASVWIELKGKDGIYELTVYSLKKRVSGGIRLRMGRKIITIPFRQKR